MTMQSKQSNLPHHQAQFRDWKLGQIVMAGLLSIGAMLSFAPSSLAQRELETVSATSLTGQCRAVNKRTPIYVNRNPVSEALMLLETDNAVILAENGGSNGLIEVNKPRKGYVHTANLKQCPPQPIPPVAGVCRQVIQSQGLVVRAADGQSAEIIGSVAQNQKVTLTDPVDSRQRPDGHIWVRIIKPVPGWVSNGYVGQQFRNLGPCE